MTAESLPRPRRAGLWPFVPVLVIGAAVIPNGIMIAQAQARNPSKVEDRAFERSRDFDVEKAAATRFVALGLQFDAKASPVGLRLVLSGPQAMEGVQVQCYRADDPSLDRLVEWADSSLPLDLDLAYGAWQITVSGRVGDVAVRSTVDAFAPRR